MSKLENFEKKRALLIRISSDVLEHPFKLICTFASQEPPFVMLKKTDELLTGNDRFEGYCIDLMAEIASRVKFNYEIRLVADQNYGAQIEGSENWNGMVGELIERVRFLFDLTS